MAAILADDVFNCIFFNENNIIPIPISLKYVPRSPTDNKPELVQVIVRRQAFTWTNDDPVHWRIYAALRGGELISNPKKHYFDGLVKERHNSNALTMELPLSCTDPLIYS